MGKSRGIDGEESNRRIYLIVGLIAAVFIIGFIALVVIDSRQQAGIVPPEGVETFSVGKSGQHTKEDVDYEQDPPVGGEHNPVWQNSGFYNEEIRNENAVHTMEHGAVWITFSPDLSDDQKEVLRGMIEGQTCMLASPYPGLQAPIVASAWIRDTSPDETQGIQAQFEDANDPNLESFIRTYRQNPQTLEPGAACTGGVGSPS